jgi:hypothetical protein
MSSLVSACGVAARLILNRFSTSRNSETRRNINYVTDIALSANVLFLSRLENEMTAVKPYSIKDPSILPITIVLLL